VFAALPSDRIEEAQQKFVTMLTGGRLPISPKNISFLPVDSAEAFSGLVENHSAKADLVIRAVSQEALEQSGVAALRRHAGLQAVLFVSASETVVIG
jgi:hypothetical protein